jgi:hypothetical protein
VGKQLGGESPPL